MKISTILLISSILFSGIATAKSYECHFTKKISYSSYRDQTPNRIRHVSMYVIYRIVGDELLTRPDGVDKTYSADYIGKWLARDGDLYYQYKSNIGYTYALSEDMSQAIEMTPSGKTVLKGYCHPMY
jgi:signal peptidase I